MRYIFKLEEPNILMVNKRIWLEAFKANKRSRSIRYRYRHPEIKEQLKKETGYKCIYCESKIGHNSPGDVEHLVPSSKNEDTHFTWENMSIACTECNRRKNDYYEDNEGFLNPYIDSDIEEIVQHLGPIVIWKSGNSRSETSIKILELSGTNRQELINRKIEKIEDVNTLVERYIKELNPILKKIHKLQLKEMMKTDAEFSGMVKTLIEGKDILS